MKKPYIKVTKDDTQDILNNIKKLAETKVMVGIPQAENTRENSGPIGNAALLFINNYGSPANNIPARPVMELGLKKATPKIIEGFKAIGRAAVNKNSAVIGQLYDRIGIIASTSVKDVIDSQEGIQGPAPSTLLARLYNGFSGTKSLIVTGQLRNAITWVLRKK